MEAVRDIIDIVTTFITVAAVIALGFVGYAFTAVVYASPLILVLWLAGWLS